MNTSQPGVAAPAKQRPWILDLTAGERSTLVATFGGWALDGMDVMVYSFVIPTLIAAWHISKGQAGLLGTAALLISAVGGWLAGLLADRFGRVRVLQITILWFALFTFLSGFTNSFWQLLMTRGLQGLGFGGEWAVGSVLMGEAIRAQHRGKAVGTVQGGWAVGWGIAAICYTVLFSVLPAATAWRAMFWIGILPALLVFYIRRNVPEPEVFSQTRAREVNWRRQPFPGNLQPRAAENHLPHRVAGDRRTRRLLRHHHLVAHVSENRARPVGAQHRRLSVRCDRGLVRRLHGQRLAGRSPWPQADADTFCRLLFPDGDGVHFSAHQQLADAGAGIPARLLRVGIVQSDGRILYRTVSQPVARLGPGIFL